MRFRDVVVLEFGTTVYLDAYLKLLKDYCQALPVGLGEFVSGRT